ncbi:DUF1905 domain-containing protein [Intrasporangium calvum]|uniref:DUF1905 domain-containing protein n=1 Tax=Intrasporangium calvum (strain ATCC 23552 / DSM 43043 / JCM 3097 / NBRC 12989 / NCIMB 10167 / NRRL B-3866 / 7 KIP) TaxID=710696 RepID=E6S8P1_INTC7|nr:DUF1905 domain-containing protein [Intrasporangium calvum]ADU47010.1 Domain of unknown function DUF1905 [Intrasporangium calvum DSM 43043]AXG12277.1 DUF1905 domain-containing protein [Intrasporangium calvum]
MDLEFSGEIVWWRGPAPYHFVRVPDGESAQIEAVKHLVTYGWGVIPVTAVVGDTEFTTSLFPKDGAFLVPLKDGVRQAESLELGEVVSIRLILDV